MKTFLINFLISFTLTLSTIWAAHNFSEYAASMDRIEAELEKTEQYRQYYHVLAKEIHDMTSSYK